jgi:hypothetical protein
VKRWLAPAGLLLLAGLAVAVHLPGSAPHYTAFSRGSFAVLASAEDELAAGREKRALSDFRAAYDRALYEGNNAAAHRIRERMGLAGEALWRRRPQQAWPFLETFALLGDDFTRDASAVEDFVLNGSSSAPSEFVYHLTRSDGNSFWETEPQVEWRGLWPLWEEWKAVTGQAQVDGVYLEAKPDWPSSNFTWQLTLPMRASNRPPFPASMILECASGPSGPCWVKEGGRYLTAQPEGPGRWRLPALMTQPGQKPESVLLFTQSLPPRRGLSILLIRRYQPL